MDNPVFAVNIWSQDNFKGIRCKEDTKISIKYVIIRLKKWH